MATTDPTHCTLVGFFGVAVQLGLVLVCLLAMLFKRHIERPKRRFLIFTLDLSKQALALFLVHALNVAISTTSPYECSSYLFVSTFDTIFGLLLNYLLLKLANRCFDKLGMSYLLSGNYFSEESEEGVDTCTTPCTADIRTFQQGKDKRGKIKVSYRIWAMQVGVWMMIVIISKGILYIAEMKLYFFVEYIHSAMGWMNTNFKIVLVLVIVPAVLNAVFVWIQDSLLKKRQFTSAEKELLLPFYEDGDASFMESHENELDAAIIVSNPITHPKEIEIKASTLDKNFV